MEWKKLGQIYFCKPIDYFLQTHAANPLAIFLKDDLYRVFFSGRSKENKSSVGYVDIDIIKKEIITVCNKSIFTHGYNNIFFFTRYKYWKYASDKFKKIYTIYGLANTKGRPLEGRYSKN